MHKGKRRLSLFDAVTRIGNHSCREMRVCLRNQSTFGGCFAEKVNWCLAAPYLVLLPVPVVADLDLLAMFGAVEKKPAGLRAIRFIRFTKPIKYF